MSVDDKGQRSQGSQVSGWIIDLLRVCSAQIKAPYVLNVGVIASSRTLSEWLSIVQNALGTGMTPGRLQSWKKTLHPFYTQFDSVEAEINEGGVFIRLAEFLQRHVQRRWYHHLYDEATSITLAPTSTTPDDDNLEYLRILLPSSITPPPIPTFQPFHAVCVHLLTFNDGN